MILRPYQEEGLKFLRANPRAFLADEMGLGKSAQMILASEGRTLIVAPAMVLDGGTWREEIEKWCPERAPDITCVSYTGLVRRDGRKVTNQPKPEYARDWDTVILDEAHYIKGRKTSWTLALRPILKRAGRVIYATGTPMPNWAQEIFEVVQGLWPERSRPGGEFGSYWRWAETWFDTEPEIIYRKGKQLEVPHVGGLLGCTWECEQRDPLNPCEHFHAFFAANLGDRFLQRLRDDVLTDLPPLTVETVYTPMTATQARMYREMKDDFITELGDGRLKVAWNSGAKNVHLLKVSTGASILDPSEDAMKGSGKLQRLAYDLGGRTRPTLVVAHFQDTVDAAREVARGLGMSAESIHGGTTRPERIRYVEQFKAGKLDVLCGSLETIAEGLTLTAADMVIFLEVSFKPSRNQQAMRRIHRIGQDRPCVALDYITPDTVDEGKRELLATKTDQQIRVLTAGQMAQII
ncbi:helicase [Streptomyces phage Marky]|nr:helicase [Streptomyces phage Marky]